MPPLSEVNPPTPTVLAKVAAPVTPREPFVVIPEIVTLAKEVELPTLIVDVLTTTFDPTLIDVEFTNVFTVEFPILIEVLTANVVEIVVAFKYAAG